MGKATDPQQAMMNKMMNFMPLMVVVFGWDFASGPVIYWVTQSVYSVVQQWLITGWGSMKDWFPDLPEMPEHRQLGYRAPRDLDAIAGPRTQVIPRHKAASWAGPSKKADLAQEQRARMDEDRQKKSSGGSAGSSSARTTTFLRLVQQEWQKADGKSENGGSDGKRCGYRRRGSVGSGSGAEAGQEIVPDKGATGCRERRSG